MSKITDKKFPISGRKVFNKAKDIGFYIHDSESTFIKILNEDLEMVKGVNYIVLEEDGKIKDYKYHYNTILKLIGYINPKSKDISNMFDFTVRKLTEEDAYRVDKMFYDVLYEDIDYEDFEDEKEFISNVEKFISYVLLGNNALIEAFKERHINKLPKTYNLNTRQYFEGFLKEDLYINFCTSLTNKQYKIKKEDGQIIDLYFEQEDKFVGINPIFKGENDRNKRTNILKDLYNKEYRITPEDRAIFLTYFQ